MSGIVRQSPPPSQVLTPSQSTSSSLLAGSINVPRILSLDAFDNMETKKTKRSLSSSNDFIYERDRFRARLQTFNNHKCDDASVCEVCGDIGSKTTKLNIKEKELPLGISPLDPTSPFFANLKTTKSVPVRVLPGADIQEVFDYYFSKDLPPTAEMFPWLHGLHHENFAQRLFLMAQQHAADPSHIDIKKPHHVRFLMCVDPEPGALVLRNLVAVDEVLKPIDVSRVEVVDLVSDIVRKAFPDQDLVQTIIDDCFAVRYLPVFLNLDPDKGVSLRNFHIQTAKLALCSDFVVYSANLLLRDSLARLLCVAQRATNSSYNVFLVQGELPAGCTVARPDSTFVPTFDTHKKTQLNITKNTAFSELLGVWDYDFVSKEKIETTKMSSATPVSLHVWVGNIWDHQISLAYLAENKPIPEYRPTRHAYCDPTNSVISHMDPAHDVLLHLLPPKAEWLLHILCYKDAEFPRLADLTKCLQDPSVPIFLEFPPSGSIGIGDCKKENLMAIVNTCKLLYVHKDAHLLIYCSDGYTELSLLVLCFLMYLENISLEAAVLKLHVEWGRPFYIFGSDVQILRKLQILLNRLLPVKAAQTAEWHTTLENLTNYEINDILLSPPANRPRANTLRLGYIANDSDSLLSDDENDDETPPYLANDWIMDVEGLLPSRILPYLYLGLLKHANSLPLLQKLGITKIISVGENLDWLHGYKFQANNDIIVDEFDNGNIEMYSVFPRKKGAELPVSTVLKVNNLQDDGIDELTHSLPLILRYINSEYDKSKGATKILVHCRVGVSRSATVCIAEVMRRLNLSLARAYLYVRVRRLNIVIQPNLRFMYELFKWEEKQRKGRRDIDWFVMCREITKLNGPYLQ